MTSTGYFSLFLHTVTGITRAARTPSVPGRADPEGPGRQGLEAPLRLPSSQAHCTAVSTPALSGYRGLSLQSAPREACWASEGGREGQSVGTSVKMNE